MWVYKYVFILNIYIIHEVYAKTQKYIKYIDIFCESFF